MRTLTILSAALIAGLSTVAMAQGGGAAGGDTNPDRMGKGSDANPSSPGATPRAGTTEAVTPGVRNGPPNGAMTTAPVSGVPQGATQGGSSSTPSMAPTGTSK
jgi:hypothetical protein